MNRLIMILILYMSAVALQAAKPVIEVPPLPQSSELELYEESEGLFTMKVLEYYKIAAALETQLKHSGITSETKSVQPSFEELEDMDLKIIQKYYKIAKSLESEVLKAPDSDRQVLLDKIIDLEASLRDTVAIYTIEKGAVRNQMLDLMLKRLQELEKQNSENLEMAISQNFVNCMDYQTWFSVAGVSKIFISNGGGVVTNDPGLGVQLALNAGKLLQFWNGFEFRYEYFAPRFFTEYNSKNIIRPREQWNTNVNSVSAGGKVIINKSPEFIHGLNLYVGYFWAEGRIYNSSASQMSWDGALLSFDYFAASPSCKFPIEFFAGFTVYNSFSRNLVFQTNVPGYINNDLGKTHISVNLGIRYNLWRSPF